MYNYFYNHTFLLIQKIPKLANLRDAIKDKSMGSRNVVVR